MEIMGAMPSLKHVEFPKQNKYSILTVKWNLCFIIDNHTS